MGITTRNSSKKTGWRKLEDGFSIIYIDKLSVKGYAIKIDSSITPNIKLKHVEKATDIRNILGKTDYTVAINASVHFKGTREIRGGIVQDHQLQRKLNENIQYLCFDNEGRLGFELDKETRTVVQNRPILIKDGEIVYKKDKALSIRPRAAIGQLENNDVIMVVIESKFGDTIWGVSLQGLIEILSDLGAINAINLDGGGNESLLYRGKLVNNIGGWWKKKYTCAVLYI